MQNFEPSRRIRLFPQNSVLPGEKGTNTAYFGQVAVAVEN